EALAAFDGLRDRLPAQRDLHGILDVLDADAVACRPFQVDVDLQVAFAHDWRGDDIPRPVDRLQGGLDLLAHAVNCGQIRAEHLDADVGAHAGGEHLDAINDGLGEDVGPAGDLQDPAHLVIHQVALRSAL